MCIPSNIGRRGAALLVAAISTSSHAPPSLAMPCSSTDVVLDAASFLNSGDTARLDRILRQLQADTGYKLRVLSRSRLTDEWTQDRNSVRCALGVAGRDGSGLDADAVIVIADRGLKGALAAGSSFLSYDIGERARFALPDIFWTRLQREYAKAAFVESRGEAASIVTTCEVILSCLRNDVNVLNEDVCTDVPPASSSFF